MLHCDYESGVLHVQKLWLNFSPLGCKRVAGGQLLSQAFKAICRTYQSIRSSPSSSSPHQVTLLDFLDYIYGKSRPPAPAPLTHLILLLMKYVKILVNTFPQTPYTNSSSILGQ